MSTVSTGVATHASIVSAAWLTLLALATAPRIASIHESGAGTHSMLYLP